MEQYEYRETLDSAIYLIEHAKANEALAREREKKGFDPADVIHCGFGWGGIDCYNCESLSECDLWLREYENETKALFKTAWQEYHDALTKLRTLASERDDPTVWALLATVLMDIDVHPDSMSTDPAELYWEAQYWYLRVYFDTGDMEAFEKAKLCEAFRHATVRRIEEYPRLNFREKRRRAKRCSIITSKKRR